MADDKGTASTPVNKPPLSLSSDSSSVVIQCAKRLNLNISNSTDTSDDIPSAQFVDTSPSQQEIPYQLIVEAFLSDEVQMNLKDLISENIASLVSQLVEKSVEVRMEKYEE